MKKKKEKKTYYVFLQFQAYDFAVVATSPKEAREKALRKLNRKSLSSMLDKRNSSVDEC